MILMMHKIAIYILFFVIKVNLMKNHNEIMDVVRKIGLFGVAVISHL